LRERELCSYHDDQLPLGTVVHDSPRQGDAITCCRKTEREAARWYAGRNSCTGL
jgi:hypothetical protein